MPRAGTAGGLAPYLPGIFLRRLGARRAVPSAPVEERALAAVLFVDLAGFTALTERFAARGPDGAERLSGVLDDHFVRMTNLIAEHGGDVVLFAGDAALAVWPVTSQRPLASATLLAAQCALDVRASLSGVARDADLFLQLRAVVAAGPVTLCEVGGEGGRWLPLVAGPALADLPGALHEARAGEIVLTAMGWELVADRCVGSPAPGDRTRLREVRLRESTRDPADEDPDLPDDVLSPYLPEVLASRMMAGHDEWIAEFRAVTVVFVGLSDLATKEGAIDAVQFAAATFQRTLATHGGTVYQFATDDKGTVLIGAFGLPPAARETDALLAVQAAMALREELGEGGLACAMGVATGRAFCGTCGTVRRRQYAVVGPVMNLAARLMQAAAGSILCDGATAEASRAHLEFDGLPPIDVKGLPHPVPVFAPTGRRATPRARPGLVGRLDEERRVRFTVERLGEGHGGVLAVTGVAGIGKSALLAALAERVSELPGLVVRGGGAPNERSTPYFAWREALRGLLRAPPDDHGASTLARLRAALDDEGDADLLRFCPLLELILPLGVAEDETLARMPGDARAAAVQRIVLRLLEKAGRRHPVAVVFDDAHWLDSASSALLRAVAERLPGVLVAVASRPSDEGDLASAPPFPEGPGIERVTLGPLKADEIRALVARCLAVDRVDEAIVRFVAERAGGLPLFIQELVLAIRSSGLLSIDEERIAVSRGDLRAVPFPDSVRAAIQSRVDRLAPHELLTLKVASAIGPSFARDEVERIYPLEEDRLLLAAALETLERKDLVARHPARGRDARERGAGDLAYTFKHALIQEAVYGLLPYAQRRQIHRRAAMFYEDDASARPRAGAHPLLAHHWEQAGDPARALVHLERAASDALRAFSCREAQDLLRRADALCLAHPTLDDPERTAAREELHGEACYQQADYRGAEGHFARSLGLRGVRVPEGRSALAVDLGAHVVRQLAHRAWPSRFLRVAVGRRRDALEHAALVFNRFSSLAWYRGDQLALVHSIFAVLNFAEEAGDVSDMVHGSAAMAVLSGLLGLHGAARFYAARALRMAEASGNPSDQARAHVNTAVYAIGSGLWDDAEHHVRRSLDLHRRLGDRQHWEGSRALEGYLRLARGELAGATECFDDVRRSGQGALAQSRIWALNGLLAVGRVRGGVPPAMIDELERLALAHPDTAESMTAHGLVAQARLDAGDAEHARTAAQRGLERLLERRPGAVYYAFWGLGALAETWVALLERLEARVDDPGARHAPRPDRETRRHAADACRLLRRFGAMIPIARPRSALCDARLAAILGQKPRARRRLQAGLAAAATLRMPLEEALLRAEKTRVGC